MKRTCLALIISAFLIVTACTRDSVDDLSPENPPAGTVTYSGAVQAILANNCLSCHSDPVRNGAPFPLATYMQVRTVAEGGSLLAAINKQTGESGAMPPTGRLPQATIDLIDQWIQDGLPE